jgi:flagellar hook-basal body complex protein FliE
MDMNRISSVTSPLAGRVGGGASPKAVAGAGDTGFSGALKGALASVSNSQLQAAELQKQVQLENPNVSLEQTMVAMNNAQVGFQATLHVRNRMVQAYTDIMNMQV